MKDLEKRITELERRTQEQQACIEQMTCREHFASLNEIKAAVKDAIEQSGSAREFQFTAQLNRRTLFDEVCGKGEGQ